MGSFITDLKNKYNRADTNFRFIYINVGIFVLTSLVGVIWLLFNWGEVSWLEWFTLPAWVEQFIKQPWSLISYMFLHASVLHLLFNMLWLYWFGQIFL